MDLRSRTLLQRRLNVAKFLAWCMLGFLALFYGYIQGIQRKELQALALRQAIKNRAMPAPRGIVYDRNGAKLVDNRRALHLVIQQEDLPRDDTVIDALAVALETESEPLKRKISFARKSAGNRMVILQDNLDESGLAKAELLRARFPFLSVDVAPRRSYLGSELAGHIMGYVGEVSPELIEKHPERFQVGEIIGKSGFEASRNDHLKGTDGMRRILVNNLGREITRYEEVAAKAGTSVYLTLDAGLQQILQQGFGTENGAAVVIDLRDGGILGLYSAPSFDPNMFLNRLTPEQVNQTWNHPARPMLNRVTQGLYPPGSTFKLLMALAALDKGIITPSTTFHCAGGKHFAGREFRCEGRHGTLSLVPAITVSCNTFFFELGARLDVDDIRAAAEKYGLTEKTGIDLPHEITSRVPSRAWKAKVGRNAEAKKWYAGETLSVAIGQGDVGITPLSLARFYGMIATRGKVLTPHLLYGTRNETSGKLDLAPLPASRDSGMNPQWWPYLDEALYQVVQQGTAKGSRIPGLDMLGKTGTAQVRTLKDRASYARSEKKFRDHAWFAGYAPRDNPQIAFAVIMENAGFGASSSAPLAKKICEYWFLQRPKNPLPPPGERLSEAIHLETRPREKTPRPDAKDEEPPAATPAPARKEEDE